MSANSNNNGRAYEFVCLYTLHEEIGRLRPCRIVVNSSYKAAFNAWQSLDSTMQGLYVLSARSTINTIFALEPNIVEPTDEVLQLFIQSDSNGREGDVRDIIIRRGDIQWEVGLSLKHNHAAVKHSRLSPTSDFGQKWYNVECSQTYWDAVAPIFDYLNSEKAKGSYFHSLPNKEDDVYVPILRAFMNEVSQQLETHPEIPRRMVEYLLSKYDFYKVISIDSRRLTTIQSFNMYGTLNQCSRIAAPEIVMPRLQLPTTLLHICFKPESKTTVIMTFDNGWQFSFRIHNAEDKVTASLKFDVQIVGMPTDVNMVLNCAWEDDESY